jgi:hypothetical protein
MFIGAIAIAARRADGAERNVAPYTPEQAIRVCIRVIDDRMARKLESGEPFTWQSQPIEQSRYRVLAVQDCVRELLRPRPPVRHA